MVRLAILASGRGSNAQALLQHVAKGHIHARVALVLSNMPGAPVLDIAGGANIPFWAESHKKYPSREAFDLAMLDAMREARIDAVVLAGYMRLLTPAFLNAYPGRVINVHPSLLPAFPGTDGGGATLAHGVKFAGCTVHFVEEAADSGPIIIQAAIAVRDNETIHSLMPRIHALEHRILPQAVQWLATDRLRVRGRHVELLPPLENNGAAKRRGASLACATAAPVVDCLINPPLEEGF